MARTKGAKNKSTLAKEAAQKEQEVKTEYKPQMNGYINEQGVLFAMVERIYESDYDEEMNTYKFIIQSYAGDFIEIGLKEQQIKEMGLFVRREQAEQQYLKHIMATN
jgi:rhamnogalacturonyl hydrolase YesR